MRTLSRRAWLIRASALVAGLAACTGAAVPTAAPTATPKPPAPAAEQPKPVPTPTTAPAVAPTQPAPVATAVPTKPAAAPTIAPTKAAIAALPSQFAALNTTIAVQSAVAYVEGADFHAMAEEIDKNKAIQPSYLGKVRNVITVVNAVPWPSELSKEQQDLAKDLKALEAALIANKSDDAAKAGDHLHEAEHDLSQAAFAWLGSQNGTSQAATFKTSGDASHVLGCIGVQSAQSYLERAGFHDLAEEIDKTKKIQPGYVGKVRNALAVVNAVPWPAELSKEQQDLTADLKTFEAALAANKVEDAAKAGDHLHEAEHDLSQASFAWLGTQKHDMGAMTPMMASDKMMMGMAATGVQSAQAYIEGAGFHEMAEEIDKTKKIQPGYVGKVRNAIVVAGMAPWPAELAKEQQDFVQDLKTFEAALAANKVEDAAKAADHLHEAEHDLSQATFAWLKSKAA